MSMNIILSIQILNRKDRPFEVLYSFKLTEFGGFKTLFFTNYFVHTFYSKLEIGSSY